MYSACLWCHARLGTNDQIPTFQVGGRVAFDPERGRLWAVCVGCARWNLAPLEERWEAVETCERLFRGTRMRASTGDIGLAVLPGGLTLVRIGRPLPAELAVWRYGRRLQRRRWASAFMPSAGTAGLGAGTVATLAVGAAASAAALSVAVAGIAAVVAGSATCGAAWAWAEDRRTRRPLTWVVPPGELPRPVLVGEAEHAELHAADDGGWALVVRHMTGQPARYEGAVAARLLGEVVTHVNRAGAARAVIDAALAELQAAPAAEGGADYAAVAARRRDRGPFGAPALPLLPPPMRVALEMDAHERLERRALDGELAELERRWREADEIATIADALVERPDVERRMARLRRDRGA